MIFYKHTNNPRSQEVARFAYRRNPPLKRGNKTVVIPECFYRESIEGKLDSHLRWNDFKYQATAAFNKMLTKRNT